MQMDPETIRLKSGTHMMMQSSAGMNQSGQTIGAHLYSPTMHATSVGHYSKLSRHRKIQRMLDNIEDDDRRLKMELRTLRREITDNVHCYQRPTESTISLGLRLSQKQLKTVASRSPPKRRRSPGNQSSLIVEEVEIGEERRSSCMDGSKRAGSTFARSGKTKQRSPKATIDDDADTVIPISKLKTVETAYNKMER